MVLLMNAISVVTGIAGIIFTLWHPLDDSTMQSIKRDYLTVKDHFRPKTYLSAAKNNPKTLTVVVVSNAIKT